MKIAHIVPSFYPAHVYGGPIQSVYHLCRNLARQGCEVRVLTTNANGPAVLDITPNREIEFESGLSVRYCARSASETASARLLAELPGYVRWADVIHVTAVYSFPTIPALTVSKFLDKPLVWSPRGALQRWSGSTRLRLKAAWELVCRAALPRNATLHVTSEEERQESLQKIPGVGTVLIPNAVEAPEKLERKSGGGTLRILFLGRIHPKKGIENLLRACASLRLGRPWSLVIAGTGEATHLEAIRNTIRDLGLAGSVTMAGEVVGPAKIELFAGADLLVAPSFTENFGMVVAEALAHAVPVIASRGMPWSGVQDFDCGLWVENDPDSLAAAIGRANRMPLEEMGWRGRLWMEKDFSWPAAAKHMIDAYRQALRRNDLPGWRESYSHSEHSEVKSE